MSLQEIIVLGIVLLAALFLLYRAFRRNSGCQCGCCKKTRDERFRHPR